MANNPLTALKFDTSLPSSTSGTSASKLQDIKGPTKPVAPIAATLTAPDRLSTLLIETDSWEVSGSPVQLPSSYLH